MIKRFGGGVLLAKWLVKSEKKDGQPKPGFIKLIHAGKRELTVEYLMTQAIYTNLFTDDEISYAQHLLRS